MDNAALELIRHAASSLAGKLEEVVTTVILARSVFIEDGTKPAARFQGASALRAFRAILQHAEPDLSVVDSATALIHEEARSALFALSPMEGVAPNADSERYSSPLREDPSPLEGNFHATFVPCGHMAGCLRQITPTQSRFTSAPSRSGKRRGLGPIKLCQIVETLASGSASP